MEKRLIKLQKTFSGIGEVKGFEFTQLRESEKGYIYSVSNEGNTHFETFRKKVTPTLIDFKKRLYSDTEFKERYPKSKDFGIWAWTFKSIDDAIKNLIEL